jgi:hypothetical protein
MPGLKKVVAETMKTCGLAVGTCDAYKSAWKKFQDFWEVYGKLIANDDDVRQANEDVWIALAIFECKFVGNTPGTLNSLFCGIKHFYGVLFGYNPFKFDEFGKPVVMIKLERTLRQLKRDDCSRERKSKFSLTLFVLSKVFPEFNFDDYTDSVIWAVLIVGVWALLRWSEVTVKFVNDSNSSKVLKLSHWTLKTADTALLYLQDTKTKLFGDSMEAWLYRYHPEKRLCPIWAVENMQKLAPQNVNELPSKTRPLFATITGHPITASVVLARLGPILKTLNLIDKCDGGVSLRKGGALTMALCGVQDRVIRGYGRWKSYSYRIYIDLTDYERKRTTDMIESGMQNCDVIETMRRAETVNYAALREL